MTPFGYAMTAYLSVLAIGGLSLVPTTPKLIWNASASAPIGLYRVEPAGNLAIADLVAVDPPEPVATLLANGGYLPRGVRLIKHVTGLPGQKVCRIGSVISVDGIALGKALERDRFGRSLPIWKGCLRIAEDQVFLMNSTIRDSLDGRYFGPIATHSIIGRVVSIWTDEDGDGRFEWHASAH